MAAALEGEPGALGRVLIGTLQRSLFIAPGIALAGIRGEQLVKAALLGSAGVTGWLFLLYSLRRGGYISWGK